MRNQKVKNPIKSDEAIKILFDAIAKQIVDAKIYYRLLCDLIKARAYDYKPFVQANTFWFLAFNAIKDAYMLRLCRIYDTESSALSIVHFLEIIRSNQQAFTETNFNARVKNNPHPAPLWHNGRIPNTDQLEKDFQATKKNNPIVNKLVKWRNNMIAHTGTTSVLTKHKILVDNPLSEKEIEHLLDQGMDILNRYSSMFTGATWSPQIVGHDDYKGILRLVNLGLEKTEEDLNKEIKNIERKIRKNRAGEKA
jgi:hypothetical protein